MKSQDVYKLFDLVEEGSVEESLVKEIIYTLENYEHLKSKMNKCTCTESKLIIEEVCTKCFGVCLEDPKTVLFSWKW